VSEEGDVEVVHDQAFSKQPVDGEEERARGEAREGPPWCESRTAAG